MTEEPPILKIDGLTKRYRRLVAVDEISFAIEPGEFVGLIGPNGAGKSTTMGCVAGTTSPDEGAVSIHGVDVIEDPVRARRNLGYVPQHLNLLDYLTGMEYLHFVADLRDLDSETRDREIDELFELTELDDQRNVIIHEFSGGMRRKLALAAALIGAPPLLVLDESFVGLDPESTYRLRTRLEDHCERGGAILLSSHILDMLQPLCDRFLILDGGQLAQDMERQQFEDLCRGGEIRDLTELYLRTTGKENLLRRHDPQGRETSTS